MTVLNPLSAELKVAITQKIRAIRKEECVRVIDNFARRIQLSEAQRRSFPRAKLDAPLCKYTGVTRKVPFKLRPQDRKGAPLCRYTGVTRKVPFKLRPKDRKKVSNWY